jgi:hypothetical protein
LTSGKSCDSTKETKGITILVHYRYSSISYTLILGQYIDRFPLKEKGMYGHFIIGTYSVGAVDFILNALWQGFEIFFIT